MTGLTKPKPKDSADAVEMQGIAPTALNEDTVFNKEKESEKTRLLSSMRRKKKQKETETEAVGETEFNAENPTDEKLTRTTDQLGSGMTDSKQKDERDKSKKSNWGRGFIKKLKPAKNGKKVDDPFSDHEGATAFTSTQKAQGEEPELEENTFEHSSTSSSPIGERRKSANKEKRNGLERYKGLPELHLLPSVYQDGILFVEG